MSFPLTFQEAKWIQTVLFVANEAGSLSIPPSYDGLGTKDPIYSMQFIRYCCGISWRGGRGVCTGNSNFTDIEVYVYTLLLSWGVCCYYEAAKITSFQLYFSLGDSVGRSKASWSISIRCDNKSLWLCEGGLAS